MIVREGKALKSWHVFLRHNRFYRYISAGDISGGDVVFSEIFPDWEPALISDSESLLVVCRRLKFVDHRLGIIADSNMTYPFF